MIFKNIYQHLHEYILLINNWSHVSYHDDIFILLCVDVEKIIMDGSLRDNNFTSIKVIALKEITKHQCIK